MQPDKIILDDPIKDLKEPIKITDEMTEYAVLKSILVRKMIKKFEDIEVTKELAKRDFQKWQFNKRLSDKLERKINREIIKVWERKHGLHK